VRALAIGRQPDVNDGLHTSLRLFITADILRKTSNVTQTKDHGKERNRDQHEHGWFRNGKMFLLDRVNDVRLTDVTKKTARDKTI